MITRQQFLVLFDIAKAAMNQKDGFAGYSNEEIMKLLNQLISQQDNDELISFMKDDEVGIDAEEELKKELVKDIKKSKPKKKKEETTELPEDFKEVFDNKIVEGHQPEDTIDTTNPPTNIVEDNKNIEDDDEDFW